MKSTLIRIFVKILLYIGQHRAKNLLWGFLAKVMRQSYKNGGEGEDYLLKILSDKKILCLVDVGAHIGMWSRMAAQYFPESKIYAIEAIQKYFDKIDKSCVYIKFNIALSNKEETLQIFQTGGGCKAAAKITKGIKTIIHDVKALSGEKFVEENNIKVEENNIIKIDFIKIDTDGYDFQILSGFRKVIDRDLPLVQFELSHWWLKLGYTIKLAEIFFSKRQYTLFIMKDDGLYSLEYQIPDHLFITANILAIHNSKFHLIESAICSS